MGYLVDRWFKANTEGLNEYGYRTLTSGGDLSLFNDNPILLYNHLRTTSNDEILYLPYGKWVNLKVENGVLMMQPEFDEDDEDAMKIARKVENGYINTCSLNMRFLEWSDDPKYLVQGQTRPTVIKWKLLEVSLTDIPGNHGCIASTLKLVQLNADTRDDDIDSVLPKLNQIIPPTMDPQQLAAFAATLGLPATATFAEVLAAQTSQSNEAKNVTSQLAAQKATKITTLVDKAIADGKITEAARLTWEGLANANYESTEVALSSIPVYQAPNDMILGARGAQGGGQQGDSALGLADKGDKFEKLYQTGQLSSIPVAERGTFEEAYISKRVKLA
ncbi:MAG: hypothetical protein RLZZ292_2620 [Bacteroidota bacterium]|jgi:hypothetical protein